MLNKFTRVSFNRTLLLSSVIAISACIGNTAQAQTKSEQVSNAQVADLGSQPSVAKDESVLIREVGKDPLIKNTQTTAQNVTSVSQLSDVKPTDWAFTALQSLVERYGCIAGYPDRTYRGQRAMTRYEFAAGLNACLDKINELISSGLADKVSKADLAALQKLQEEFAAELATLRGRVDALEAKTAKLEAQQFSTTTKLNAEAIFAISATSGNRGAGTTNVTFSDRVRLNFDTSFTGKDRLRVRLQAGNPPRYDRVTGTTMTRLGFDNNRDNTFEIDSFFYRFPIGNQLTAFVGPSQLNLDEVFSTVNPLFESSGNGSISRFGRRDPLVLRGPEGAGAGLSFKAADWLTISGIYSASNSTASQPTGQGGLFGGGYETGVQVLFTPAKNLQIGAIYLRTFEPGSSVDVANGTGSSNGRRPFGPNDTSANRYGLQASWRVTPGFNLGGWVGLVNARQESGGANNTADLINWNVNLAFPDLFGEGNLGGIIFGQPPKVTSNSIAANVDSGTSYHLEALYRFRISKNINITPGFFVIFNPNHNSSNDAIWVGTLRTTFTF